jgi:hypothetical protein
MYVFEDKEFIKGVNDVLFATENALNPRWPPRLSVIRLCCNNFGSNGHIDIKLVFKGMFFRLRNSFKVQTVHFATGNA